MKNKATIIAVVVLLLVVVGGLFLVKGSNKEQPAPSPTNKLNLDLPDVDPSVEVSLEKTGDGRSVVLTVANIPDGVDAIEYELSYNTGEGLPKGALGKISVSGDSEAEEDILLGTCSTGGKCTYDTGVTSAKVVLVFHHPDGDTKFVKEYPLD